jgi:hypothetical protein
MPTRLHRLHGRLAETKERADFGTMPLDRACGSSLVRCNLIVQIELMRQRIDHLGIDLGVGSREAPGIAKKREKNCKRQLIGEIPAFDQGALRRAKSTHRSHCWSMSSSIPVVPPS